MGLSAVLAKSASALDVYTTGLAVSGNNLANAATPGYAREELSLSAGLTQAGVRQSVNLHLETRLHAAATGAAGSGVTAELFAGLERVLGELTDGDLSTALSDFSAAVGAVVAEPDSAPLRQSLLDEGAALAGDFRSLSSRAADISDGLATRAGELVGEANDLIEEVHSLNRQIVLLERGGFANSDAGQIRDKRYAAMQRLSEIVPLEFRETKFGAVELRSGDDWLVLGDSVQTLELVEPVIDAQNPPLRMPSPRVRTSRTHSTLEGGGELGAVLEGADRIVGGFLDDLDGLAAGLIEAVNRVHSAGRGTEGFSNVTASRTVDDPAASLAASVSYFELPFPPAHGGFTLTVVNQATGAETDTRIAIDLDGLNGNDTSLNDLVAALNAVDGVSAGLDSRGRLTMTAASGRQFHLGEDDSGVLASLGLNHFFDGRDAGSIGLAASLKANPALLAVGRGGGPGDNSNVLALADALAGPVRSSANAELNGKTIDGRFAEIVGAVNRGSAAERALAEAATSHRDALASQREQFSGVSLDEEAVRIMELQRQYQASARVISVTDSLLETLINM
ncbi:flagellar hook-associated protein FlgK [Alienimonas californiensis]|uniref:Flagellar hook-associated protein 1 n=1 Tax=Alienimonas californiensis TaxID=2527989 RepID=A0A517P422_9PLAN|nr:flagellar basal body rod C-terminal domain-containing protein [Alienimonas californiensis]QDT14093.1 Flagellar hook-associated protein 1 [Alienimonas californiensis]